MRERRKEIKLIYGEKYYNERLMKLEEIQDAEMGKGEFKGDLNDYD